MKRPREWPAPPPAPERVLPSEAWFIEYEVAPGVWTRYAGAFDDAERAKSYYRNLCPRTYRIREYVPGNVIITAEEIIK